MRGPLTSALHPPLVHPAGAAVETAQNRTHVAAGGGGYPMATPDEEARIADLLARHADLLWGAA